LVAAVSVLGLVNVRLLEYAALSVDHLAVERLLTQRQRGLLTGRRLPRVHGEQRAVGRARLQ